VHILGYRVQAAVVFVAVVGLVVALVACLTLVRRGTSWRQAVTVSLLAWTVAVMLAVSLAPDVGREAAGSCSFDLRAQPPWTSDQRLLNVLMYVPVGFLAVLAVGGRRSRAIAVVAGVLALAAVVELVQQVHLVGRSCDVADMVDNWIGAALGASIGMGVALVDRRTQRRPAS
jgi:VanZ family protein